jgi:transcriptional regulator GlxA family with amidase domain
MSRTPTSEIALLAYPDALASALHGLTEMFLVANRIAQRHDVLKRPLLRVSHWQGQGEDVICSYDTAPADTPHAPVMVIVPPRMSDPITPDEARPFSPWLRAMHDKGAAIGSVCAGSFLLGEAGLLEGRVSTTHWSYVDAMAKRFPNSPVDGDKLMIDDGDIITAGGFMAWTDMGLRVIHRLLGPTIMLEVARFMLVDPAGREQRHYSSFAPRLNHGDSQILKVQHWLQTNGAKHIGLKDMAAQAGLEDRTFLRRFTKATGLKPTEYAQRLRVGKAREMLEFTNQSVEQISWAIGYEDPGAFRKIFQRVMGLTPVEYRQRFSAPALTDMHAA